MKIFVTGATGFIGRRLIPSLLTDGHEVTALSRSAVRAKKILGERAKVVEGNPLASGSWQEEVGRCDAVINLCGEPILKKKWTPARKRLLLDSRIIPTKLIVAALETAQRRPQVLVSGSAISYYGSHDAELLTEDSSPGPKEFFAVALVVDWENEALKANRLGVRVVTLRTGIVLGRGGGALTEMTKAFKFFAGGPIGNGRQYMSWIHIDDHIGMTKLALTNSGISDGLNMTAPSPVTNREFMRAIGRTLGRPSRLPVPGFVLKLLFGEGAGLLLEGQRVLPKKAQDARYQFLYSALEPALANVLSSA